MRLKTWSALAAAALTLPLLSGCGDDNAQKGDVRLVNATSEYTSLDLYTQASDGTNSSVVGGIAAGAASSYVGIDKGTYTFVLKSTGAAANAKTVTGTVNKTDHFSVVAYLTGGAANAMFLSDDESAPAKGNAKLRVFNAASGEAASVDVYLTTNACSALTVVDTPFASAVSTLQTTYSQVTAAAAGTNWHTCVFNAGDKTTLLLDIPQLTLKDQEVATLILTHTSGGTLLNGAVLDQQGTYTAYPSQIARVRVAADIDVNTGTTGLVSVTLNGTAVSTQTPSQTVTSYTSVASGTVTATATVDGVDTSGFTLPATTTGKDYTLLVSGTKSNPVLTLIADDNTPSSSTTQTVKARVLNGINGTSITVSAAANATSLGSAAFGTASTYVPLAASTTATIQPASTIVTNPTSLTNQTLEASGVYTIFIWGPSTGAPVLTLSKDR